MPRIPSAADVKPVGAAVTRLPTVRASAEDFGLDVARGLKDLAGGISDIGPFLGNLVEASKKSEAAKQAADEAQHRAAMREAAIRMVDTWEYDGSSPQEAAAKSVRDLEAVEDERLKQVPAEQRATLKAATAPIRKGQALRVAQRAQNQSVAVLSRQTEETLQLLQKQAVREPEAAAHYAAEGRAQLQALLDAGALTTEQFAVQEETFRRGLYTAVIRGQPAVQALADLEDGVHDEALGASALKDFLIQETAWRLQSETAQGAAAAEAQLARLRRGEQGAGGLSAATQRILAAGDMADAELQAEQARRVRSELQSLRFAPEAEIAESIAALAPAADAADAAARQEIQQEVWTQSQIMLRERHKDPAAYVMEQPAVAEAFAAAAKNPTLLADAVSARLAAQAAMGLAPEAQNALTIDERTQILTGLQQLDPEQRIAALMELGKTYADRSATVAADLVEAGLPLNELLAADPSGGPGVSGRLAQAGESQGEAKTAGDNLINEAAERHIAGSGEEFGGRPDNRQGVGEGEVRGIPPAPRRKPVPRRSFDANETIRRYGELRDKKIADFADRPGYAGLAKFANELEMAAATKGVGEELLRLARPLVWQKGAVEKYPFDLAYALAADEIGIEPLVDARGYNFDTAKERPAGLASLRTEAGLLLHMYGFESDVENDEAAAIMLPALREFWRIREATRLKGAPEFERLIDNLVDAGERAGIDLSLEDVRKLAWDVVRNPVNHPWAQTRTELANSILHLALNLEKSGKEGLVQSVLGIGLEGIEFVPDVGPLAKVAGLVHSVWDAESAVSDEQSSALLAPSVLEYFRREGLASAVSRANGEESNRTSRSGRKRRSGAADHKLDAMP